MADNTAIEWTDATWNPIRARNRATGKVGWFCTHASAGCVNCYAEGINRRLGTGVAFKAQNAGLVEVFADDAMLTQPLRWKRPRKIFVGSMTDLFGDFVSDAMIDRVFAVMALAPQHTYQVLTKRIERARRYLQPNDSRRADGWGNAVSALGYDGPLEILRMPPIWLGVSAEDQANADERIPVLLDTPAAKRFVSLEPLIGGIRPRRISTLWFADAEYLDALSGKLEGMFGEPCARRVPRLDWVIVGGESGPHARPMHPDWVRRIRDDCAAAGVPFLFKQWGEWAPEGAHLSEDRPEFLRLRRGDRVHVFEDGKQMARAGKRAAGRVLDGVTHDAFPPSHNQELVA